MHLLSRTDKVLRTALLALGALMGFAAPLAAQAQGYPERPIKFVVPYPPGGGTDVIARIVQPRLQAVLGQSIVIENKGGAGGSLGTDIVSKAAPDGYTVLFTLSSHTINPAIFPKLPYDTLKDFEPVGTVASLPQLLAANPGVPVRTVADLVAQAKAAPEKFSFASVGNGSPGHLAGELMKQVAGVDIVHIPYKGTGPAMADLLGGHVNMQFSGISSARPHVDAGKLRALVVTGRQRNPAMRDVPTFEESGVKGVDADSYWGLYAPSGVPAPVLATLNRAFGGAMRSAALADRLADLGFIPIASSPEEGTRQMRAMIARWTEVVDKAKIKAE